jgi:hypothetical protein
VANRSKHPNPKEKVSFRLSEKALGIIKNYPSTIRAETPVTVKLEEILTATDELTRITRHELKGFLTFDEAMYIIDITNSFMYAPIDPKCSLMLSISDSDLYDSTGDKWGVNAKDFVAKIDKLSAYQCHIIFIMSNEFRALDDDIRNGPKQKDIISSIFCL